MAAILDLTDIPVPPKPIRSPFLRLPPELRNNIYRCLLVEADKLSRRHNALCPYADRKRDLEPPPFSFANDPICSCKRRHILGLLLTNRQIHSEAAQMFWSDNMHYFEDSYLFSRNITNLREQYRDYIHRIGIVSTGSSDYPINRRRRYGQPDCVVWDSILKCRSLRKLELEPAYIDLNHAQYSRLRAASPYLNCLTLVHLQRLCLNPISVGDSRQYVYVKISEEIALDLNGNELQEASLRFRAMCNDVYYNTPRPLPSHLKDNNNKLVLKRGNGDIIATVVVYGLPNSDQTRSRFAKQRLFEQNRLKAAGLPSLSEMRLSVRIKENKDEKERQQKKQQMEEEALLLEQRELDRDRRIREQAVAEAKQKANQRAHKERKVRKAEKLKREERKRVPKKT
ncbi:hypothetical protein AJ79_01957 [Helicocarpus griseus UAMH5409]|uniref:F-box domain-containing protein n=1 Tax=Helicocarpus griseus UAMH5409 TaxID=1447875 RepID=A0A2B7Y4P2_9EURO|nr:hypothetical protein AJ79_01957 [Helicocarpus griseus UAMH5409]